MEVSNFFIKNNKKGIKEINLFLKKLNRKVEKYDNDHKPILTGDIQKYEFLLKGKKLSLKPQNINKVIKDFSPFFQRAVKWQSPGAMINITPPANYVSMAASLYTSFYNPNFAQDESSGYLMATELLVSKYLSELANWNANSSGGIFTFGGKGTNLYATKIGIKKALDDVIEKGIQGRKIAVISSEKGHPCHQEVCDWLGIGKNSCLRIPTDENGQMNLEILEKTLCKLIEEQTIIGSIIVNGGTTNEVIIDPIKKIVKLRDKLVKKYNMDYVPHIHVDAVIGWAWLFFDKYNFEENPLKMDEKEITKIKSIKNKIVEIKYADSFGADFHKTGFCPYISSIFMAKKYTDITSLGKNNRQLNDMCFGEYSPFEYTLELTRSSMGPVSALMALESFGIEGFQKIIYSVFSNCEYIRKKINEYDDFEVINSDTEGIATLFVIKPPKEDLTYKQYVEGNSDKLNNLLEYNHQFYLYCLNLLEKNEVNFKITFSKSYKPYGAIKPTGALKIYPMSPVVKKKQILKCINEIKKCKDRFDLENIKLTDDRKGPMDYVYRD